MLQLRATVVMSTSIIIGASPSPARSWLLRSTKRCSIGDDGGWVSMTAVGTVVGGTVVEGTVVGGGVGVGGAVVEGFGGVGVGLDPEPGTRHPLLGDSVARPIDVQGDGLDLQTGGVGEHH